MRQLCAFPLLILVVSFIVAGCGGGEDFSKPPEGLSSIKSKSKGKPESSAAAKQPAGGQTPGANPAEESKTSEAADTVKTDDKKSPSVSEQPSLLQAAQGKGDTQDNKSEAGKPETPEESPVAVASNKPKKKGGGSLLGILKSDSKKKDDRVIAPTKVVTVDPRIQRLAADISENGDTLVAEREDGRIGVFDVERRSVIGSYFADEQDILELHYDDARQVIAAVLPSGRVQLWQHQSVAGLDTYAREAVAKAAHLKTLGGHANGTLAADFSPTREEIATVGSDGFLRIWRMGTATAANSFDRTGPDLKFVQANLRGNVIASLTSKEVVTVWQIPADGPPKQIEVGDRDYTSMGINLTGDRLALGDESGAIVIADVESGKTETLAAFQTAVADITFDSGRDRMIAISRSGEMRFWDLPIQPSEPLKLIENSGGLFAISSNRRQMAYPSGAGTVDIQVLGGDQKTTTLKSQIQRPAALSFLNSDKLAISGDEGKLELVNSKGLSLSTSVGSPILQLSASSEGSIAAVTGEGSVRTWKPGPVESFSAGTDLTVMSGDWNESSNRIAIATTSRQVLVFDTEQKAITNSWDCGGSPLTAIAISDDGESVVTGHNNGEIFIWQIRSPENPKLVGKHSADVTTLDFDNGLIFSGDADGKIRSWKHSNNDSGSWKTAPNAQVAVSSNGSSLLSLESGKVFFHRSGNKTQIGSTEQARQIALSSNGNLASIVDATGNIAVYDTSSNVILMDQATASNPIIDSAFLGNKITSVQQSGDIATWTLNEGGSRQGAATENDLWQSVISAHTNSVSSLIAAICKDGTLKFVEDNQTKRAVKLPSTDCTGTWLSGNDFLIVDPTSNTLYTVDADQGPLRNTGTRIDGTILSMEGRPAANDAFVVTSEDVVRIELAETGLSVTQLPLKLTKSDAITSGGKTLYGLIDGQIVKVSNSGELTPTNLPKNRISFVKDSADGVAVLSDGRGNLMIDDGSQSTKKLSGITPVFAACHPSNEKIAFWANDGSACIFDFGSSKKKELGGNGKIDSAVFSTESSLATMSQTGVSTIKVPSVLANVKDAQQIQSTADGKYAIVSAPTTITILNLADGVVTSVDTGAYDYFDYDSNSSSVITASKDGRITGWQNGQQKRIDLEEPISALVASSGKLFASSAGTNNVRRVDIASFEEADKISSSQPVSGLATSVSGVLAQNTGGEISPLRSAANGSQSFVSAHASPCLSIIADASQVWTGSSDGNIRLWNRNADSEIAAFKHTEQISAMQFDKVSRQLLVTDRTGAVLSIGRGSNGLIATEVARTKRGGRAYMRSSRGAICVEGNSLADSDLSASTENSFQCNSPLIASGTAADDRLWTLAKDGEICLFNFSDSKTLDETEPAIGAHWLKNNRLAIVTKSRIDTVSSTGSRLKSIEIEGSDLLTSTATGAGTFLAISDVDGQISVFDSNLQRTNQASTTVIPRTIRIDDQGKTVILLTGENEGQHWDLRRAERLRVLSGHKSVVRSADFVRGSDVLVSASVDGQFRLWAEPNVETNNIQTDDAVDFRLLTDGNGALSIDASGIVSAWSADAELLWTEPLPTKSFNNVSVCTNAIHVATLNQSDASATISVRDRRSPSLNSTIKVGKQTESIYLTPNGESVVAVSPSQMQFYDISSGAEGNTISFGANKCILVDGDAIFLVGTDGLIHQTGTDLVGELEVPATSVTAVAYDNEGDRIVTGSSDGEVALWSRADGQFTSLAEFQAGNSPVRQLIFSGNVIVARTDSPILSVWLLEEGGIPQDAPLTQIAHPGVPALMRLDSRQEFLVTTDDRNQVYVWFMNLVPGPPKKVLELKGHRSEVVAAGFARASRDLITLDQDASVAINTLPDAGELRRMVDAKIVMSRARGSVDELPKSTRPDARRQNGLLAQQLKLQQQVRKERLKERQQSQSAGVSRSAIGNAETVSNMGRARAAQLIVAGSSEQQADEGTEDVTTNILSRLRDGGGTMPSIVNGDWQAPPSLVSSYQNLDSNKKEFLSSNDAEDADYEQLKYGQRKLVDAQAGFVKDLQQAAVDEFLNRIFGSGMSSEERGAVNKRIEQLVDDRAIQTIQTEFIFPEENERNQVEVRLRISSDGRTIISSFPSVKADRDEPLPARLDVWDMVSGVPLKQFDLSENANDIFLVPDEDVAFSIPQVTKFELFRDGAVTPITTADRVAFNDTTPPVFAFGRTTTPNLAENILELRDANTLEALPISMPQQFNASTTALSFSEDGEHVAFAFRQGTDKSTEHRLFICRPQQLDQFELLPPAKYIPASQNRGRQQSGIYAAAFSPDNRKVSVLYQSPDPAVGRSTRTKGSGHKIQSYKWQRSEWLEDGDPQLIPSQITLPTGSESTLNYVGDLNRVVLRTRKGFWVSDLRSEENWLILIPTDMTSLAFSQGNRWLAIGREFGQIQVYDLTSRNPAFPTKVPFAGDKAHYAGVLGLAFSRPLANMVTPTYLASFGRENAIKVWDMVDLEKDLAESVKDFKRTKGIR